MRISHTRLTLLAVPALLVTALSLNALFATRAESASPTVPEPGALSMVTIDQDLAGQPESRTALPALPASELGKTALHQSRRARSASEAAKPLAATRALTAAETDDTQAPAGALDDSPGGGMDDSIAGETGAGQQPGDDLAGQDDSPGLQVSSFSTVQDGSPSTIQDDRSGSNRGPGGGETGDSSGNSQGENRHGNDDPDDRDDDSNN